MNNNILNYGVYYTLDNGFSSYTEINETTKEGLENGFMDVHEVIDISWILNENEFPEDTCVDSWNIKQLEPDDIIYLNEEDRPE